MSATTSSKQAILPESARPPEISQLLTRVDALLVENQPAKAIELIARSRLTSPWIQNALGVCRLRLGQTQAAVDLFRGMVVSDSLELRSDVPAVCKTNYATALLLNNNLAGCQNVLKDLGDDSNPACKKLRDAIDRWKSNLSLWQKLQWYTGTEIAGSVPLDFPPGDL